MQGEKSMRVMARMHIINKLCTQEYEGLSQSHLRSALSLFGLRKEPD